MLPAVRAGWEGGCGDTSAICPPTPATHPHHITYDYPESSLGSDMPCPSGLPSQISGTPGGETLSNAFIPISVHPAVCPELPKQCLLLFSCLDPSDVLPAASLTQKRGFGVCGTLEGAAAGGHVPPWWHNHPSKLKCTPGQVWSFAVCLANLFMEHLCKIHTHFCFLSPPTPEILGS